MHHFDALRRSVLPPLIERARGGGRVRLWSAGCSTGQEAFSIAMTLFDLAPDAADLDIRILATDIDPGVITDAQTGLFDVAAAASIPPAIRQRFTDRVPDGLRIAQPLRSVIRFRELNLLSPWPMRGHFDVIFCRNVVIYFAPATQAALWPRLAAATGPEGWLFVGHSERVPTGPGSPFSSAGITTYRMRGGTVPVMPTEKDTVASWR
jgi:chemotaxis protein methyltransferase CheR